MAAGVPQDGGGAAVHLQSRGALRGRRERPRRPAASRWPGSWPASTSSIRPRWRRTCTTTSARQAVRHLFTVAASLDSMVVGEPQILAQVKQAYQAAVEHDNAGPLMHAAFQAAIRVARRVATETAIHQRRVSIPSVAVADFAQQIFERFDDKQTLVIGAGRDGRRDAALPARRRAPGRSRSSTGISTAPRSWPGSGTAARRPWEELLQALAAADLVISTTGAGEPDRHAARRSADRSAAGGAAAVRARPGRAPRFRSGHRPPARRLPLLDRRPAGRLPAEPRPARQGAAGRHADRRPGDRALHGRPLPPRDRPGDPAAPGGLAEAQGGGAASGCWTGCRSWTRGSARRSAGRSTAC